MDEAFDRQWEMKMKESVTKLHKRIQWLRRREITLSGRVFGPRFDPPEVEPYRFIGHIGQWDAYLVDELVNCQIWLIKAKERVIVSRDQALENPVDHALHRAVLAIAETQFCEAI